MYDVEFAPNERWLATASDDRTIRLWTIAVGETDLTVTLHHVLDVGDIPVRQVRFSPDSAHLVAGRLDGVIQFWDVESGTLEQEVAAHTGPVTDLAWSPNGENVVSVSLDGTIRLWGPN